MAVIHNVFPPGHWKESGKSLWDPPVCVEFDSNGRQVDTEQCSSWEEHYRKEEASLLAFPHDKIWQTPIGDGYAYYLVEKTQPLTVVHIPYLDAYHAPPAHLRGLRMKDIREHKEWERKMSQLFKGRFAVPADEFLEEMKD